MGQLKDSISQAEFLQAAQNLGDIRQRMRRIGGEILSLAAAYRGVQALASDSEDATELIARKAEAINLVRADIASADADTKAIILDVLKAIIAE